MKEKGRDTIEHAEFEISEAADPTAQFHNVLGRMDAYVKEWGKRPGRGGRLILWVRRRQVQEVTQEGPQEYEGWQETQDVPLMTCISTELSDKKTRTITFLKNSNVAEMGF